MSKFYAYFLETFRECFATNADPDQTERMRRLILTYTGRKFRRLFLFFVVFFLPQRSIIYIVYACSVRKNYTLNYCEVTLYTQLRCKMRSLNSLYNRFSFKIHFHVLYASFHGAREHL